MPKYYLEIDYEPIYDIDSTNDGTCNLSLVNGESILVDLGQEVTYREFTPFVVKCLEDLKKLLNTKDIKIICDEGGILVDYVDETIWDETDNLVGLEDNIIELAQRGVVGKFSKVKTCKLKEFIDTLEDLG